MMFVFFIPVNPTKVSIFCITEGAYLDTKKSEEGSHALELLHGISREPQ